jgi:MFS family permease
VTAPAVEGSAWSPLRVPVYRRLWLASLASNVGTWMQNVAAVWLMTSLTTSATLVALVQSATALPMLVLAVFAGALTDVVDRRRLIIATQLFSTLVAAGLGLLALSGLVTPWVLLGLTAALGLGSALYVPASQAINPELVPKDELPAAVALGGVSMNGARAVGPALGGALVAATGPGAVFLVNAASFLGVAAAAWSWRREATPTTLPAERLLGALRAGLRYARHAPELRAVLVRAGAFVVAGSATMALLPVVATRHLHLGALGYGALLGCIGAGAVVGAALMPRLRRALGRDGLVVAGTLGFAAGTAGVGLAARWEAAPALALTIPALLVAGLSWITTLATFNTAAQTSVPAWVRGRALGLYLTVFQGGMALASAGWGALAERLDAPAALLVAAGVLVASCLTALVWRLQPVDPDLQPSHHWPDPQLALPPATTRGPVMVTVEYEIAPDDAARFLAEARELERVRRRDGATLWAIFRDAERAEVFVETFVLESWDEHLRQHARVSQADLAVEARVKGLHRGAAPPRVRHLLGSP